VYQVTEQISMTDLIEKCKKIRYRIDVEEPTGYKLGYLEGILDTLAETVHFYEMKP